jgi:hypothetical protein
MYSAEERRRNLATIFAEKVKATIDQAIENENNNLSTYVTVPRPQVIRNYSAKKFFDAKLKNYTDTGTEHICPFHKELLSIENGVLMEFHNLGYVINVDVSGKLYEVRW